MCIRDRYTPTTCVPLTFFNGTPYEEGTVLPCHDGFDTFIFNEMEFQPDFYCAEFSYDNNTCCLEGEIQDCDWQCVSAGTIQNDECNQNLNCIDPYYVAGYRDEPRYACDSEGAGFWAWGLPTHLDFEPFGDEIAAGYNGGIDIYDLGDCPDDWWILDEIRETAFVPIYKRIDEGGLFQDDELIDVNMCEEVPICTPDNIGIVGACGTCVSTGVELNGKPACTCDLSLIHI